MGSSGDNPVVMEDKSGRWGLGRPDTPNSCKNRAPRVPRGPDALIIMVGSFLEERAYLAAEA